MAATNTRMHPRTETQIPIDWWEKGTVVHRVSSTSDIGPGGLFVITSLVKPRGTAIEMRLVTDAGVLHARGKVAWVDDEGRGLGIAFER